MLAKKSFGDAIRINKVLLQSFGVLPLDGSPSTRKTVISYFLIAFAIVCNNVVVGPLIHVLLYTPVDLAVTLDVFISLISILGGQIQMLIVIVNRTRIQRLLSTCEHLWADSNSTDHKILMPWAKRGEYLSVALLATTCVTADLYVLIPVFGILTRPDNSTARTLPWPIAMNTSRSPQYEIAYTFQAVACQSCATTVIGCDAIVLVLILTGCGHLKLIQSWLSELADDADDPSGTRVRDGFEETLKRCVRRHQIVLDYCMELEELVSNMNLVQVLAWMYIISLAAANLFGGGAGVYKSIGALSIGICQLLFLCWPSQELSNESFGVANAVYNVPWERCSTDTRTTLTIMIMRAQRPATLTAGKYAQLSLETFSNILSSAVSFFMVLQSF